MENQEHSARAQLLFLDKTVTPELTEEFTLPDYNSEISRLLWVTPTVLPPTRFVGNGRVDFTGPVRYDVLYAGPDQGLYAAQQEGQYSFSVPLDAQNGFDPANGAEFSVVLTPEAVVSRVVAPRKLALRCRLRADVRGYTEKDFSAALPRDADADVQYLWELNGNGCLHTGGSALVELSDTFSPEGIGNAELRLIAAHGGVSVTEATAVTDGVRCRGEAVVTCLLSREEEGERPFAAVRRIPFEAQVPLDGATPDCRAAAVGHIAALQGRVENDAVSLELSVVLTAEAQCEEPVAFVRDLFAPGYDADCTVEQQTLWHAGPCRDLRFGISADMPFAEAGLPANAAPLDCTATATVTERATEGDRTVLSGEVHVQILYRAGDEYGTGQVSVPFRTVCDGDLAEAQIAPDVENCRLRADGDRLHLDADVALFVRGWQSEPVSLIAAADMRPAAPAPRADLEICYPAQGETLWDVSKRYGVTPAALADANGIDGQRPGDQTSLSGVRYLLIPG